MVQKRRRVLWAKPHLKWTVSKWKSVLLSDEYKFYILVGKHGCRVLRAKEERDLPVCYQHSVQKPASLMVWRCMYFSRTMQNHILQLLQLHGLRSRRVWALNWSCLQSRSFTYREHSINEKHIKYDVRNSSAAGNLYQTRTPNSSNS